MIGTWNTRYFFLIYYPAKSYELDLKTLKMHILWCRTDICSCKLSAKISLVLVNPSSVPSLCKLNNISVVSSRLARRSPTNNLLPIGKTMLFWSDPRCFGLLGKFQHNIEISIKTVRVSRLSVPCDYYKNKTALSSESLSLSDFFICRISK